VGHHGWVTDESSEPAPEERPTRHLGDLTGAKGSGRPLADAFARLGTAGKPNRVISDAFAKVAADQTHLSKILAGLTVPPYARGIDSQPIRLPPPPARAAQIEETNALLGAMVKSMADQANLQSQLAGAQSKQHRDNLITMVLAGLAVVADGPLGWRLAGLTGIAAWRFWPSRWTRIKHTDEPRG
jgi:hypothetical protein